MDESYVCQSTCAILCLRRTVSLLVVNIPTIKVSKCYWFQGSFCSGFDNFSPAGLFQKLAKPCKGVWPCIDGFVYDFRVLWGGMTAKCLMATFCLAKMKEKTYMFNEKNAIDQGILATSKTLAVNNAKYLFEYRILNIEVFSSRHADHRGNSHHILESRRLVHRRYLSQKNIYTSFWKQSVLVLSPKYVNAVSVSEHQTDYVLRQ